MSAATLPFLLEIGAEEIPDWMIQPALKNLRELFEGVLAQYSLGGSVSWVDATPRRLVLRAEGLAARQADRVERITGPPESSSGTLADHEREKPAIKGFLAKYGAKPDDLYIADTPKGRKYAIDRKVNGRTASEILAAEIPSLIGKIYFPKTMYWTGKGGFRFIRPIRWIVAVLGSEIVPFEIAGVKSSHLTWGHRRLSKDPVIVNTENYEQALRERFVLVRASERRTKILSGMQALSASRRLALRPDDDLVTTLVYLTEYPTPILGEFESSYLTLPTEVLVTVMRHHQRYTSLEDSQGRLAPFFIAVMNIDADREGLVKQGNERVLRARFNDGRFFWDVDQQKKLADRLEDLRVVTFQAKLGSYYDKTQRVVELIEELGGGLKAKRAALLAKCDLTCEMVKEFTELQGVVGGLYARFQGECEEVTQAINDQYKPESMDDSLPRTKTGQLLSLADKLDTLRGCFEIGLIPTSSKDPFALRRAAQGVVRILAEGEVNILVPTGGDLGAFFRDRIEYYFREIRRFPYDEVRAAMAAGFDDLKDLAARLEALRAVRPTANFEPIAASFKRIQNILRQAQFTARGEPDKSLLEPGPERELFAQISVHRVTVKLVQRERKYREALELIASLRPYIDHFFDKVLVNAPDQRVRENRLRLLDLILTEFSAVADFSEIVTA